MFRSKVIVAALTAPLVLAAAVYLFTDRSCVLAQAFSSRADIVERAPIPVSIFFGSATSRDNDFFLNSLMSIYQERFVPAVPERRGHFSVAQSNGPRAGKGASVDRSSVPSSAKSIQKGGLPGALGVIKGAGTIDPNVDKAPMQRDTRPEVLNMVGPVSQDDDLRALSYIAPKERGENEIRLNRHTAEEVLQNSPVATNDPVRISKQASLIAPNMPSPTQTFAGMSQNCGGCLPPDTDGDVGPNHYIQSVNSSITIYSKTGATLSGPITYNSFFAAMGGTTGCGTGLNDGDGVVFYDHMADRWIVTDFAFPAGTSTGAGPNYECIGVSKTSDPVSGGWWLYAVQVDPANTGWFGDYPKFGMWPDAYYMSVNLFQNGDTGTNSPFEGVRVFALNRAAMINGGPASTIAFNILAADLGDQYSLVPASFRTGSLPPVGQPEWFLDVNSSATAGTSETQVFVRRLHVDFANPANSTFGVGAAHNPDGVISVNGFVDAFTSTTTQFVPNGTTTTTQYLDTLGDKLMYPLIYQNVGGVESLWADQSVNNNQNGTGPVSVRWYQFNVTGNTIPTAAAQQQTVSNADGIWRWMPSINVDNKGNMAIGYSASSTTLDPQIRYGGRLASDPVNGLGQGEATLITSGGHQTRTNTDGGGRWGDYSTLFVDPTDGCTFYHTNEYYTATSTANWATRVGSFVIPGCTAPLQGTAHFTVTNCISAAAVSGASIAIDGYPYGGSLTTGVYDAKFLAQGSHTYSITKTGNSTATGSFSITNGDTANIGACIASGTAHFVVTDSGTSQPISGAAVSIDGSTAGTTSASGTLDVDGIAGNHAYQVSKTGFGTVSGNYTLTLGQTTNVPVNLSGTAILGATKTADSSGVIAGQAVGFKVTISNSGTATATGVAFSDPLPGGSGVAWSIDLVNTDAGWSLSGSAPNQSLIYSPNTLASGATSKVHITSATSSACVASTALNNTATLTAGNATQVQASAGISVACQPASSGNITVTATAGTAGPTGYSTVKAAFDAINGGTHRGAINIWVYGNTTETASAVLNASGTGSASYTSVFMLASGGARTISGSLAGSSLIDLAGADNVTIDGVNSGGASLTLSNTSVSATAGTSTIRFINGASNNVIKNTFIQGSSTATNTNPTANVLFSTTTGVGNNNNTLTKNDIGPAGTFLPSKLVMSLGTASAPNIGNVIDNNDLHDSFASAQANAVVDLQANNDVWTISNNRIFESASRTFTGSGLRFSGVLINSTGTFTITGNRIGFATSAGTGTMTFSGSSNEFRGIALTSSSTSTYSTISGNTISGVSQTTSRSSTTTDNAAFIGIQSGSSAADAPANISGNTIGSLDGSSTVVVTSTSTTSGVVPSVGIMDFNFTDGVSVTGNNIGSITIGGSGTVVGFRGIFVGSTAGLTHTVSNNIIGGTSAASITDTIVGSVATYGIQVSGANAIIQGNTVRNLTGSSTGAGIVAVAGIITASNSTGASTVSRNLIYGLTNNSGAAGNAIRGCQCDFGAAAGSIVERNFIHSLTMSSTVTTGDVSGIAMASAASGATYKNNFIRLGVDATGASITSGIPINGIFEQAGTNNLYFNSVYIGGSGVASAGNTFGLNSSVTANTRNYLDNIFFNARSNASGAGKNYAITVGGSAANPVGLTSNYNDLYVNGTGGVLGRFNGADYASLAAWRTATGQDANSLSVDPLFINPTGTSRPTSIAAGLSDGVAVISFGSSAISAPSSQVDLHVQKGTPLQFAGIAVAGVTDDFDGALRGDPPDIGGDQFLLTTAAHVGVSGRVLASDGAGLRNARVVMRDSLGNVHAAVTSAFGYYHFNDVEIGSYVMSVEARKFSYATRIVEVNDELTAVDFLPTQ